MAVRDDEKCACSYIEKNISSHTGLNSRSIKLTKPNLGSPSVMSTMCGVMEQFKWHTIETCQVTELFHYCKDIASVLNTCTYYYIRHEFLGILMFTCTKGCLARVCNKPGCSAIEVMLLQVARHPVMGLTGVTEEFGQVS
jgi:hypothetical protein